MILFRYLAAHISKGTLMVLLVLVSLSLFFSLIRELDDLGTGQYGIAEMVQYLVYRVPGFVVEFMPLAILIGSLLSLGNLASGSEIIVMQAAGLSLRRLVVNVAATALIFSLISILIANLVVPATETGARNLRTSSLESRVSISGREGIWIKDNDNILHIEKLYPDGNAQQVSIFHLDPDSRLTATTRAENALLQDSGWRLQQVERSRIDSESVVAERFEDWNYYGELQAGTLESLATSPRQMSVVDLSVYIGFLRDNELSHGSEMLSLWQKLYSPLTIIVMGILAIPFILASQRQSNTGQRVMTGILLGLLFVVLNRLMIQIGEHLQLVAFINALLPTLVFLAIFLWLMRKRQSLA